MDADERPSGATTLAPHAAGAADDSARARWQPSPWVLERRGRISFQVQPCPTPDEPAPIERALAAARLAEELGFDAVSFGDHPILLDCWVWLAAVAATTHRIRLGPGVACAAYRPPRATARLATDLDHLSGGRLVLGLGSGWVPAEFEALGVPFASPAERGARLAETLDVVTGLWGPAPVSVFGEHYTPRQQPRPPIMVAGGGQVTLRLVAQYADACNIGASPAAGSAGTPEAVADKLAVLRRHCETIGRPYDHVLRTHFTGSLVLARDEAGVQARRKRYDGHRFIRPEDVRTPADAVVTFQALADVGIEYFLVQSFDVGDQETLRLLAEDVAPRVRVSALATHPQHVGEPAATLGRPVDRSHEVDVATNPVSGVD
jgi:alkanesulfonate monooxygenase SsuD/methylene tetrahydromethanopterin reductase-like flavin-dependent oxidoreductase (luciferase family)